MGGLSVGAASGGRFPVAVPGLLIGWLRLWSTGSRHLGFSSRSSWAVAPRLSSYGA